MEMSSTTSNSNSPLPTNAAANQADSLIKTIENILLPIVENAIIAACPDLGLPIVKQIVEAVETGMANSLTALIEKGVTFKIIDNQVGAEENSISAAQTALLNAEKTGNQNEIQQAEQNFENAQDSLIADDGSSKPQ
jgi:hypothetical protein